MAELQECMFFDKERKVQRPQGLSPRTDEQRKKRGEKRKKKGRTEGEKGRTAEEKGRKEEEKRRKEEEKGRKEGEKGRTEEEKGRTEEEQMKKSGLHRRKTKTSRKPVWQEQDETQKCSARDLFPHRYASLGFKNDSFAAVL